MEDKSYVGMASCFVCGEVKHLLLDRRLKNSLPQKAVYDKEPCDKCKEIMKQGIIFIGIRDGETKEESGDNPYRTGQIIGVKDEAVKKMGIKEPFLTNILKSRFCFMDESSLKHFGFIKDTGELKFEKKFEEQDK